MALAEFLRIVPEVLQHPPVTANFDHFVDTLRPYAADRDNPLLVQARLYSESVEPGFKTDYFNRRYAGRVILESGGACFQDHPIIEAVGPDFSEIVSRRRRKEMMRNFFLDELIAPTIEPGSAIVFIGQDEFPLPYLMKRYPKLTIPQLLQKVYVDRTMTLITDVQRSGIQLDQTTQLSITGLPQLEPQPAAQTEMNAFEKAMSRLHEQQKDPGNDIY